MRVIITGGAGFLGQRLAASLLKRGRLRRPGGEIVEISSIALFDRPEALDSVRGPLAQCDLVGGDISDSSALGSLFDRSEVSIFHLASIVSGQGEQDFDLAMRVNLDGGRNALEAARAHAHPVTFVTTSSIAVFGPSSGEICGDDSVVAPATTYGATKAVLELLVNDYSRKGFIDGRVGRIPTIVIRPGAANAAASSAASAVFREPLAGRSYALPVSLDTKMALAGVTGIIEGLIDLHEIDAAALGQQRVLSFPSISVSFAEMIATLRRRVDASELGEITVEPDAGIQAIVNSWPKELVGTRAVSLGIRPAADLDSILEDYLTSIA